MGGAYRVPANRNKLSINLFIVDSDLLEKPGQQEPLKGEQTFISVFSNQTGYGRISHGPTRL